MSKANLAQFEQLTEMNFGKVELLIPPQDAATILRELLSTLKPVPEDDRELERWHDRAKGTLSTIFHDEDLAEYILVHSGFKYSGTYGSREKILSCNTLRTYHYFGYVIKHLDSRSDNLDKGTAIIVGAKKRAEMSRDVFVVHGHDEKRVQEVARVIEKLGLNPIVLREQPNGGRTIIEKFEALSDVDFAVVLMTADDVGRSKMAAPEKYNSRARQNVILELGYFVGRLGRSRVAVLKESDVEEPSDIHGVVYTALDHHGAWKYDLVRELKQAGYKVSADSL